MTILIPEPLSIVICQCFCFLMDVHMPFVPNQPKTGSSMVPMKKFSTKKFSAIMRYDESKDLAFCHLCMLAYRD